MQNILKNRKQEASNTVIAVVPVKEAPKIDEIKEKSRRSKRSDSRQRYLEHQKILDQAEQ
jgi:hypothetical protein